MSQTEQQARALLAQLTARQRVQLALEILQEEAGEGELDLPTWLIESSTQRLARYQSDPSTGKEARKALDALGQRYGA